MSFDTSKMQPLYRWSGNGMASRGSKTVPVYKHQVEHLPRLDHRSYYDAIHWLPAADDSLEGPDNRLANRTNLDAKTSFESRFSRHGKLAAWSPMAEEQMVDQQVRKRLAVCLEEFLPDAAAEVGVDVPVNVANGISKRQRRDRIVKRRDDDFVLPHLRSPSPPLTADELAPMLSVPQSYLDIMTSPSMRYTLGDDTVEQGLQRTASELLECEKPLLQSLGKLRDMLRMRTNSTYKLDNATIVDRVAPEDQIPELPDLHETDNLWRVQQDLLQVENPPAITYTASEPHKVSERQSQGVMLTAVQQLFVVANGITLATVPNTSEPIRGGEELLPQQSTRYNINLSQQITAVDDALERVSELLADCNEYKERLEEARSRVANVARARKRVWSVVRERAAAELDNDEQLAPRLL